VVSTWRLSALAFTWVALAVIALISGWFVAGGSLDPAPAGLPEPEPVVTWGAVALRFATIVLGLMMVGVLVVSRWQNRTPQIASFIGLAWVAAALLQVLFVLANVLALPLHDAASFSVISTYAGEIATTRALILTAALVFLLSLAAIFSGRVRTSWIVLALIAAALPSLASHTSGVGDHSLAVTANAVHAAAATLWVGTAVALFAATMMQIERGSSHLQAYSSLALTCWLALGASGFINGYVRLDSPDQLLSTGYGQLLVAKAVLLAGIGLLGWRVKVRWAHRTGFARLAAIDIALLSIAVGLGVALASSPYPRLPVPFTSLAEALTGAAPPSPPTWHSLVLGFSLDPVFAGAVLVGLGIMIWNWGAWPTRRRLPWLLGLVVLAWSTNGGLALYALVTPGAAAIQTAFVVAPVALLAARGWFGRWPLGVPVATTLFLSMLLLTSALSGWAAGSYVTRTALLVAGGVAGALFFAHLGRNRPSAVAGALVIAVSVVLVTRGAPTSPWFEAVQPDWVADAASAAATGGLVACGIILSAVVAGLVWPMSDLPVSVDRQRADGKTEPF